MVAIINSPIKLVTQETLQLKFNSFHEKIQCMNSILIYSSD